MNSLQIELNEINEKLELLTYRKTQLDAIITEYSDVVNRVKNLIDSMQDANVEPSNLLIEIESLIYCPEPEPTTPEPELELTPEPTAEPQQHFDFDLRLFPKTNSLGLPVATPFSLPEPEQPTESEPDITSEPTTEATGRKFFPPKCYWDYGTSLRLFIPRKRRGKGEIEAIVNDCFDQGLAERYDLNQCGDDWIIQLASVTSEDTVNRIISEFYPQHTDGESTLEETPAPKPSNPELVKLMALVPVAAPTTIPTSEPTSTPTPKPKTQLNERAWRRDDTLLIGFTNKKLMNQWSKWIKESWGDRVKIDDYEKLENFDYCLSILWHCKADWERLKAFDYSLKPNEQQRIETDAFEYKQATETTIQIFRDGVLLGLAKNCDSHWESPQFKGEQFESREALAEKLWDLIDSF